MKGNDKVIELLNEILTNELTAINQYFIHAKMCQDWGYGKLAEKIRAESIDEMKHAEQVIDRILFLDGVPNLQRLGKVNVGQNVPEQFKLDLALEMKAQPFLNECVKTCQELADNGSFEVVKSILVSEEEHIDWLESQLSLIDQLGVENYLAQQL